MRGAVAGSGGWGGYQGAVLVLPVQLGAAALRFTVLLLVLLSPRMVPPLLLVLLGQHPGTGPCPCPPGLSDTRQGWGRGNRGRAAGRSLGAAPRPGTLWVPRWRGVSCTPELCSGTQRVQSPQGAWWVTPSQLPATAVVGLRTPGWVGGAPPKHSFCLRVCLSGRAGAACALSANAAPRFLMLMLL